MRAYPPSYEMQTPRDLKSALKLLKKEVGQWKPFAGGTDLMVLFEDGTLPPGKFLNLWPLKELRGRKIEKSRLTLGSLTTYADVLSDPVLGKEFPLLCDAARETGAIAIQNRGTLGGNIANASPAADTPPALLVYEAELELVSAAESRWVPYREFHSAYKKTVLRPDELIARIRLPRTTKGLRHYYRKVGTRKAQSISKVCFAGLAKTAKNRIETARIALGSVAPTPIRCPRTEAVLAGKEMSAKLFLEAREMLLQEISPIDDIRSTVSYRQAVAGALLVEFLEGLAK